MPRFLRHSVVESNCILCMDCLDDCQNHQSSENTPGAVVFSGVMLVPSCPGTERYWWTQHVRHLFCRHFDRHVSCTSDASVC